MFKFALTSRDFNDLLRRLVSLSGSDESALICFDLKDEKLQIFYKSKLDKSDSYSLFHEFIPLASSTGSGNGSLYLKNIFTIKVPETISEEKYPQCGNIEFTFNDNIMDVNFGIKWNKTSKVNQTKLHFPLVKSKGNLKDFEVLFRDQSPEYFEFDNKLLHQGIGLCNFIKSDVTGKHTNGCLLRVEGDDFLMVNTDSNVAVKFETKVANANLKKKFTMVVTNQTLNAIKTFVPEDKICKITTSIPTEEDKARAEKEKKERSQRGDDVENIPLTKLFISVENRTMLVPVLAERYIINDPRSFFKDSCEPIAEIDIKPVVVLGPALLNKIADDIHSRFHLNFSENGFNLSTNVDKTEGLPAKISKPVSINVNGSYLLNAFQRLNQLGIFCQVMYNEENNQLKLISEDSSLVFLIQALSL